MHGSAHAGFAAYDQMRAARAAEQAYRHHSSAVVHSGSLTASADPLAGLHSLQAAAAASNSPTNTASSLDHHHVSKGQTTNELLRLLSHSYGNLWHRKA